MEREDFQEYPDTDDSFIGGNMKRPSFFDYISTFTTREKSQLFNLFQYGGLSVVPNLIVLKLMKLYVPDEDPFKSSTELLIEVILQLVVIVVAFFFIHKLVVYVPTYSKIDYDKFSLLSVILPLFFLMFTLDTKISAKLNVLFDRLLMLVGLKKEGMDHDENDEKKQPQSRDSTTRPKSGTSPNSNSMLPPPQMSSSESFENRLIDGHQTQRGTGNDLSSMMPTDTAAGMLLNDDGPMAANSVLGGWP